MRKGFIAVAIVFSSVACGGLLGFGADDDEDPVSSPVNDAGGASDASAIVDAATADTQVAGDGGEFAGCQTYALVLDPSTGFDSPQYKATWSAPVVNGGGFVGVESDKRFFAASPGNFGDVTEATIFATLDGRISRVQCSLELEMSTNAVRAHVLGFRVEGSDFDEYAAFVEWNNGEVRAVYQTRRSNDGGVDELFNPASVAPAAMIRVPVVADLLLTTSPPTFTVDVGTEHFEKMPPGAGVTTRAQIAIGIYETSQEPFRARYDKVLCHICP